MLPEPRARRFGRKLLTAVVISFSFGPSLVNLAVVATLLPLQLNSFVLLPRQYSLYEHCHYIHCYYIPLHNLRLCLTNRLIQFKLLYQTNREFSYGSDRSKMRVETKEVESELIKH